MSKRERIKKKVRKKKDGGKVKNKPLKKVSKKKRASLRVLSTITPSSPVSVGSGRSGLEEDIKEVDFDKFSEFVSTGSGSTLGDSVTSLEVEAPVRNLEEIPAVQRSDADEGDKEDVSYEVKVGNVYADSGAYVSDSERTYTGTGGEVKASEVSEVDFTRRNDFTSVDARDFVSPELRDQKDDDYVTRGARAYSSLDSSGNKRESKKKRDRGF